MKSAGGLAGGFTLWELVIVLTIVLVLGAIAIPAYLEYATRSKASPPRPEAPTGVDKALKGLKWGNIAFDYPADLAYGESAVVQLLLSGNETGEQLLSVLTEGGARESYEVRISNSMEAHLTGVAFEISPVTPERQLVSSEGVAEWKWEIRAKEIGRQKLFLTLIAHVKVDEAEQPHTVRSFSRALDVHVAWPDSAKYFIWNYWQWICSAIALPLLGWLGVRLFGRRST